MTGTYTNPRRSIRIGGLVVGLLILAAACARPVAASDVTVTDSTGGTFFVASKNGNITWNTTPTGFGWSGGTKLALYASRALSALTIAGPGTSFTVTTISGPNTINLSTNPVGTINVGDRLVVTNAIVASGNNNGVYIVASVTPGGVTITGNSLVSETVSALAVAAPGAIRFAGGSVEIRTTTPHGLSAFSSFVRITGTDDVNFGESKVQVTSTPTATTFTYQASLVSLASTGNGQVFIIPNLVQDGGSEVQFIQNVDNNGSLARALPNLIGTDVYYFLVDRSNSSNRIRSDAITVRGIQMTSPAPGNIVTALQTPSPVEIRMEMMGYPGAAGSTTFKLTLSRDGLFSGGVNDEVLADLFTGANAQMTAVAPTLRGATAAYVFRLGAMTWTAPLTPEARIRVKTYGNLTLSDNVTDETGPTSGDSHDGLTGAYIDRAFRIGAGSGAVPMFTPNGGEVIPRVDVSGSVQTIHTATVRYIPLASTVLPVTTVDTGMLLEFSGDSGNTWEPLNRAEFTSSSLSAAFNLTTTSFAAPTTINVTTPATGVAVGAQIVVTGAPLNNGTYTVAAVAGTTITVTGAVVNEVVAGTVAVPAVITVPGGLAGAQVGAPVLVQGSALNDGTYTVAAAVGTTLSLRENTVTDETVGATVLVGTVYDPSSSRFLWNTVQDPSSRCRLRTRLVVTSPPADIGADNGAITNDIVDTSNSDFTLRGVVWKGLSTTTTMPVGTTQTLTWVSAGSAGRVNLRLSRNGGLTFETIAANTDDDGSYDWLVTGPVTDNAILYIEHSDQPNPYFDRTPLPFTIQGYTVVTPNGGEVFQIGSLQAVLWISAGMPVVGDPLNAVNITLTYTDPATGTPTSMVIATGVPNNLNYDWTLANTIPGVTDARVQIANQATPALGPGLSNNPFTIQRAITLSAPNGGNTYVVGEVTPVTWVTTGLPVLSPATTSFIRPELLKGTFLESSANTGAARVSNVVTLKTVAAHGYTTGDNVLVTNISDTSFNGTFNITVTGANTFTYPQAGVDTVSGNGEVYKASRVLGGAKIDSIGNTGLTRATNVVTVKTTSNHGFLVGDSIRIVDCSDAGFVGTFTVTAVPTTTTFQFAQVGLDTTSGGGAAYRAILTVGMINSGALNAVWTTDDVATLARVRLLEVNSGNVPQPSAAAFTNDVSDNAFAIQSFVTEPEAISVTAPNGGESFVLGQSVPVTWTSSGQVTRSNTVTIRLTRDTTDNQGENIVLAANVANTGTFNWLVSGAPTNRARIIVTSDADSNVTDLSDGDFIVKGIQILTPNSLSDSVAVGGALSITWNYGFTGVSDTVKIEISRDGGTAFTSITANTANNGSFLWISQQPVSASTKIRVTSNGDTALADSSDANFQLRGLTLTSPVGGETWNQGSQQNVTWTSVLAGSFVDLDLSLDGGKSFQRIGSNAANNGSLVWTVAQPFAGTRVLRTTTFTTGTNTIAFVAGSNLTGIAAGDKITVTGTVSNNGLFTVATVAAGSLTVSNALTTEVIAVDVTVAVGASANTPALAVSRTLKTATFTSGTNTIGFTAGANLIGIAAGDTIKVTGTTLNDGTYTIATVAATTVTVTTPLATEAIAVDASVRMQPTNTRILRTVNFDGASSSIIFASGTILSGIAAGQTITVAAPSINAGSYTIVSVGSANVVVTGVLANETATVDASVTAVGTATYYISQPSAAAMLRVTDTVTTTYRDSSDAVFLIPPVTPSSLVFAALPNAQPPFQFGTATTLQWNGMGMGATATLAFSSDSGVTFTTVDSAVPNNTNTALNTFVWTAPNISTTSAVLRLTSNVAPNPAVSTAGVFTVMAPTVPSLLLTPTPPATIDFTAVEDGASPADRSGTIVNIGSLATTYTLTVPPAAPWLRIAINPSAGAPNFGSSITNTLISGGADNLLFRASVNNLAPGTYTAVVALTASGGALGQVPYTVNFTVTPAGIGLITVTPVVASVPEGSTTATVVTIQNRTSGNLTPVISGVPAWATMTTFVPAIVSPTGTASSTLTLSGAGLTPGVYTAVVTINNNGSAPSRTFTIQFTVTAAGISFENKKKSCAIGGPTDGYSIAGFALPFAALMLLWLLSRRQNLSRRFFRTAGRVNGLSLALIALVLAGSAPTAQAATIGSAEEGPSLFGIDVRVPNMLHAIDGTELFGVAAINENVPLQKANFGGLMLSSGWINHDPRGWLPKHLLAELQISFVAGTGLANIQAISGASITKYDARIFNGRMLFAMPLHMNLDEGVRIDDRHPIACNMLATIGYHYILVDFDKTTVNELGRGLEVAVGSSFEYGLRPGLISNFSVLAVGRLQTYNNAFKDSKFNASVEGQFAAGLSWNFTPDWQLQLQATGTLTELVDFHRYGGILSLRYTQL